MADEISGTTRGACRPAVVGASSPGIDNLIRFAKDAMERDAAGLMVPPLADPAPSPIS